MHRVIFAIIFSFFVANVATAQSPVWVQVEAQPTLTSAQNRVRDYAARLENVNGFYLGSGWYGIVLGPYAPDDANTLLRQLQVSGAIPRDSFIAFGNNFRQQFWPIGVGAETQPQPLPGTTPGTQTPATAPDVTQVAPDPLIAPDETVREARTSEAALTRPEREQLQIALKWAGFYGSTIDGAFGRGTRSAMEAWQIANNQEATGVLTTRQRAELIGAYNAVLDGMNLQLVRDDAAGIEIQIPTGVVTFAEYEPPFVRFQPKGELQAQVLLISQEGDQNRLYGLYEILQTLAIIPVEGPRTRRDNSFELEGIGDGIHSYTTATLRNGQIKGFSLIWPIGDEERRSRVLAEMQASFAVTDGVLDPAIAAPDENQAIDLIAGLEVRKPRLSRSGFYIDRAGQVLTTIEAVQECARITLDGDHETQIVHTDPALGIAVLKPIDTLAPISVAAFQSGVPRLQAEVAVAGYPYGEALVSPALTFGRLADLRGLNGEEDIKRLALTAQPGDAGGPVFDNGGAVLGMLRPKTEQSGQALPADVSFAVDADQIVASLSAAGIATQTTDTLAFMPPETLTLMAADTTVLVSCW